MSTMGPTARHIMTPLCEAQVLCIMALFPDDVEGPSVVSAVMDGFEKFAKVRASRIQDGNIYCTTASAISEQSLIVTLHY